MPIWAFDKFCIFIPVPIPGNMLGKLKEALNLQQWIDNFEGYLDARIELMKYDVREALVGILTKSVFFLGMAVFGMVTLICFNFGLANLLNSVIGNAWAGYMVLTGFYFLLTLGFYLSRDSEALNRKMEERFREALKQPGPASRTDNPDSND